MSRTAPCYLMVECLTPSGGVAVIPMPDFGVAVREANRLTEVTPGRYLISVIDTTVLDET